MIKTLKIWSTAKEKDNFLETDDLGRLNCFFLNQKRFRSDKLDSSQNRILNGLLGSTKMLKKESEFSQPWYFPKFQIEWCFEDRACYK